ncbi:hypothetical protein [Sulfurisphaera ohwakuensis]
MLFLLPLFLARGFHKVGVWLFVVVELVKLVWLWWSCGSTEHSLMG